MTTEVNRTVGGMRSADEQELDDLRDYFDNAGIGLHWLAADGIILRANRADYELLGYGADEYVGRNIAEFHVDQDVIGDMFACLKRGETLRDCEARLRAKDGSIHHVLVDSNVLWRDGAFVHTRCFTRDNTEHARYRSIAESMPAMVTLSNADGTMEFCNQRLLDYTGLTLEEAASGWRRSLFHPEDFAANIAEWRHALASGETIESEYRARRSDGIYRWHLARMVPICADDGSVRMWVGAHIDIHDRREAEDALRMSQRRVQTLTDSPVIGVISGDAERICDANDAFLQMTGYTRQDIDDGDVRWREITPPEWAHADEEHFAEMLERGVVSPFEKEYLRKNGTRLPIIVGGAVISHEPLEWICFAVDLTERKRAEAALQLALAEKEEAHALLQTLLQTAPVGIVFLDRELRYLRVNAAAAEMDGLSAEAHIGKTVEELLPGLESQAASFERVLATGEAVSDVEVRGETPAQLGVARTWLCSYYSVRDSRGDVAGAGVVFSEITERKRIEEEREKLLEDLRVANAAKDEFLGLVSHELKTPITTILGNAMVLRLRADKIDAASRDAALQDMSTEAERLHHIIDNLLVLARLEQGQAIVAEPLLISRIVDKLVAEHRHHFPHRTIGVSAEERLAPAGGEPVYVEQVLRNLLSNAEKYSPTDNRIDVVVRQEAGELLVSVIDGGAGFSDDEIEQVFAPFYRSPRIAATIGGVGIGLSVCKRLIEAQGGRVWARGAADGGAEVGFSLPIAEEDA